MMSAPRRPARAGFGIARDSATKMPAATSLRIVDLGRVCIRPVFDLSFTSCSFRMGQLELLVYSFVSRVACPRRSRSAAIFTRIAATYDASVSPSRLISTLATAPRAPASAIEHATSKSDRMHPPASPPGPPPALPLAEISYRLPATLKVLPPRQEPAALSLPAFRPWPLPPARRSAQPPTRSQIPARERSSPVAGNRPPPSLSPF